MSEEKDTVLDDFGLPKAHFNNQKPNKIFLRFEQIFTLTFVIGYLFMWNDLIEEGFWITFLSLSLLGLMFSFGYFLSNSGQFTVSFSRPLRIIAGILLGFTVIGLLFRIMAWRHGYELSFFGVGSLLVGVYMVLRPNVFCHTSKRAIRLALRFILWGGLATFYHFN